MWLCGVPRGCVCVRVVWWCDNIFSCMRKMVEFCTRWMISFRTWRCACACYECWFSWWMCGSVCEILFGGELLSLRTHSLNIFMPSVCPWCMLVYLTQIKKRHSHGHFVPYFTAFIRNWLARPLVFGWLSILRVLTKMVNLSLWYWARIAYAHGVCGELNLMAVLICCNAVFYLGRWNSNSTLVCRMLIYFLAAMRDYRINAPIPDSFDVFRIHMTRNTDRKRRIRKFVICISMKNMIWSLYISRSTQFALCSLLIYAYQIKKKTLRISLHKWIGISLITINAFWHAWVFCMLRTNSARILASR